MRPLLILLISLFCINASAQKKTSTIVPYSIANIKLGMTYADFISKYPDATNEIIDRSTKTIYYDVMTINQIIVTSVMVKFYKEKLFLIAYSCDQIQMHNGLSSKYTYDYANEFTDYDVNTGVSKTIGSYVKENTSYDLFRIKYDDDRPEMYLMYDKNLQKKSESEGF